MENDTDFAQIEKRKKKSMVYLPEDWTRVIKEANLRKPFEVREMDRGDFKDWKSYLDGKYRLKAKDTTGRPLRFREIHWVNVGWAMEVDPSGESRIIHHPDQVWFRNSISRQEPWIKVDILHKESTAEQPPPLYDSPIHLNPAKVRDLKKMAQKHLPEPQKFFYLDLA